MVLAPGDDKDTQMWDRYCRYMRMTCKMGRQWWTPPLSPDRHKHQYFYLGGWLYLHPPTIQSFFVYFHIFLFFGHHFSKSSIMTYSSPFIMYKQRFKLFLCFSTKQASFCRLSSWSTLLYVWYHISYHYLHVLCFSNEVTTSQLYTAILITW